MKATVTAVSGKVQIKSRGSITWRNAKLNELLSAGDTIETKENGVIEIRLENGNAIDLKPDSQLVLQKLTQDTKTGDYENLFESSRGRLRAKVSKLKGGSKFEIKTPTAVAGARGTIIFLNITPGLTSSYFEEGNGYVQSTISGVSKVVTAGNSSSADANGNVTDPQPPSDAERSGWQEGWETGGDTGDSGNGSTPNTGENFSLPPDDPVRVEPPPIPPSPPVSTDWNGTFSGDIHDTGGNISGTVSGKYSRPSGGDWGSWSSDSSGTYNTAPTGAWSTIMAGSGDDESGDLYWAATMSGSAWAGGALSATVEGVALHDTSLGEISGSSIGVYTTPTAGAWSTADSGTTTEIVDLATLGITEVNLAGNGWGNIGGALMAGVFGGETVEVTSSTGTFIGILAGTGSPSGTWKLALGMTDYYAGAADGYALATADNSGVFYCVYFGEPWSSSTFTVGKATGSIGTITNVDTTSWYANVTSGSWVDLAVLTTSALGFTQATLADFVSVPITETYTSLLTQTGGVVSGGTITGTTMDMSFYTGGSSGTGQIWTALIDGNYTGTPLTGWTVITANGGTNATLTGTQWSGGQWAATVAGTAPDTTPLTGEAGGTYTGGTLTGVGAGTW